MIRIKEIQSKMLGLVGWKNSDKSNYPIRTGLSNSESGLYYQDAHPFLTLKNIAAIMPQDYGTQFDYWDSAVEYEVGDVIAFNGSLYECVEACTGLQPDENSEWVETSAITVFLKERTNTGIADVIKTFIREKDIQEETKSILERRTLFDGAGRIRATIQSKGRICGYEIVPVRSMGVTTKIERIGLQMTGATGNVTLYLFHSSQVDPIKTINLNFTKTNGGFQWFEMKDLFLPYISQENNAGGSWYLVYNQNELPMGMEAINVARDFSKEPCGSCNQGHAQLWKELTKHLWVSPFAVTPPDDFDQDKWLWDIQNNIYTNTLNYGINVELSIGCDLTDFFISQREMFSGVLQKQVAFNLLREIALNPDVRVNRNQLNVSKSEILYELDGNTDSPRAGGLGYDLSKYYKALSINTNGIDRICLKCKQNGIKVRSI